jgi:hypothetical protein
MKSDNQLRIELGLPMLTPRQVEKRQKQQLLAMRMGHAVGPDNKLHPIPGAFTGYDSETGRPVIAVPLKEREPLTNLRPVSIDALVEADGDVNDAESVMEVGQRPKQIPVAGEDVEDDDLETIASERAADAALACAEGLTVEDDNE